MNIPKKLKINSLDYDVEYVNPHILDDCYGEHIRGQQVIRLAEGMTKDYTEITILHEILHAINSEIPEWAIISISQGLHQITKDNPELWK